LSETKKHIPYIGLTGGIGCGKSTALQLFNEMGAATLSVDEVVHSLYREAEFMHTIVKKFGPEVMVNGIIDRSVIATKVFKNKDDLYWLEQTSAVLVHQRLVDWKEREMSSADSARALVVEVPLLFEMNAQDYFDATLTILADEKQRDERANARGHQAVSERAARQLTQEEKADRSTHVIGNYGTVAELREKLALFIHDLIN
jgi:dephospho-CoA kinase